MRDPLEQRFVELAQGDEEIPLDEGALLIAGLEYPHIDVGQGLDGRQALAEEAAPNVSQQTSVRDEVKSLCTFLYAVKGFDGNRDDYRNLIKLGQVLNAVHTVAGYPVEPMDLHPSVRHLYATHDMLTLSDKVPFVYSLSRQRNLDAIEMTRIARGADHDAMDVEPSLYSVINASTPLRYDTVMLHGIQEMSARNQCIVITPFTLAGAMAPVTVAGALVLQNAEALAGIAYTQVVRAGAPVIYGAFTSNVDMRSGAPAFGTPEYWKACLISGQLARRYRVP